MKVARPLLLGVSILALLLLAIVAVALNSSFQTWAARRALARQPDLNGTIGSVSAGFQRTEVRALRLDSHGAILNLPSLDLDMPLIAAGVRDDVHVRNLVAKGWTLDLTKVRNVASSVRRPGSSSNPRLPRATRSFSFLPSAYAADAAAASAATTEVFRGVFAQLQLPVDVAIDAVELEGEVILPPQVGRGASRFRVAVRGGGLRAGNQGSFVFDIAGAAADGGALTLHGTVTAAMDTPRTFTELGAKMNSSVSGTQFPDGVKLQADATVARAPNGETYNLLLTATDKQLATAKADLVSATARVTGTWKIDLHDTDFTPFLLGRKLPTFAATGQGAFETGTALEEVHATGNLKVSADRLEVVRPELSAVGAMNLTADFDVLQHGDSLRVEKLDGNLSGDSPVASIRGLQSFEFNMETGELRVADPTQDLVGVSLTGLPLAWAKPFLGELQVTGGDVRGEFALSAREGGLGLRSKAPLTLREVSVSNASGPLLDRVDVSLNPAADYTPQGWQAEVKDLTLSHAAAPLLTAGAKAGQLAGENQPIKITGTWTADIPAWTKQPAAAGQIQLASGQASGGFTASLDGTKAVEATVVISKLIALTEEPLPTVTAELRADLGADGKTTFNLPLVFELSGRKSDLLFSGSLVPSGTMSTVDARVTGEQVVVQDVQLLGLLIPADTSETTAPGGPDDKPFWGSLSGQVTLAIRKLVYAESLEVSDVGGTLRLDPSSMNLENVRAIFGPESDLKLSGGMKFDPKAGDRYVMAADLAVNNFDTVPAFKALDPAKLPTIEARINLSSRVEGSGTNIVEVAERARGDLQVTANRGVFRALSADLSDKVQRTQSTVATLGGLIGGLTGKQEYADYANKTQILSEIAKALSEIPFDQLNVTANRDPELNLVLKDFTLISPEVRLTGGGTVQHVTGTSLLAQPLSLQLNLGARGKLADLLKRAGLLDDAQDNLGYAAFVVPIKVAGSLGRTDTRELRNALLNSALERSGLLDLLGK